MTEARRFPRRAYRTARRLQKAGVGRIVEVRRVGAEVEVEVDVPEGAPLDRIEAAAGRRLLRDLIAELAPAHAAGWVHGALRPESVAASERGYALRDLAFACLARGSGDERDDVRGIGEVAYRALTGEAPLAAPVEALPASIRPVILRCLHDDPDRRYGSLDELAAVLGLQRTAPPRRSRRWLVPVIVLVAAAGAAVAAAATRTRRPPPPAAAPVSPTPPPATQRERPALVVGDLGDRLLTELVLAGLTDEDGVEAVRAAGGPVGVSPTGGEAKRTPLNDAAWTLGGRIAGGTLEIELHDARRRALALARRIRLDDPGRAAAEVLVAVRGGLGLPDAPFPGGSLGAWRAHVDGLAARERGDTAAALAAFRRAAAEPGFVPPRLELAALVAGKERTALIDELIEVAPTGRAAMVVAVLRAGNPAEQVRALEALRERFPHDTSVRSDLARAYRAARRPGDCAREAERTGLTTLLAWCRLEAGDDDGALAAAAGDDSTTGDLALAMVRFGPAREAYRRRSDGARLLLVAFHQQGRCRLQPREREDETVARVRAVLLHACGDRAPAPAGRAAHVADLLAGGEPGPLDRLPLLEPPVLFEVALGRLGKKDVEGAARDCAALSPAYPLAAYCRGRAADAAGDRETAVREYRTFLDRWADADPENRWWRDARRRLVKKP